MKKIFSVIFITLTFLSCKEKCENEEGFLTEEESSWLVYSGGETLVFKSNSNLFDTIIVSQIQEYYTPISHGATGSCNPKQQSRAIRVAGNFPVVMDINSYHQNEWSPDGKAYVMTSNSVFNFSDFNPQNGVIINGNVYNSVYVMTTDTSSFSSKKIWCIYYTKQNGILRYDLTQGEQWEKIN